jgi:hypothetical protein
MAFKQLVRPWYGEKVEAGACLVMAQSVVGAPGGPYSATVAANATRHKHWDRAFPGDTIVVLWFSHWGTYQDYRNGQWRREDWGHVVIRDPNHFGRGVPGYYSSRRSGYGPGEWFRSVADIEREFSSSYRFWSEDINSVRVCMPAETPSVPAIKPAPILEEDDMIFIRTSTAGAVYAWNPLTRKASANGYPKDEWEAIKDAYAASNGRGAPIVTVTPAVFKSMTGRNA